MSDESDSGVRIPARSAEVAHRELAILIRQTNGSEDGEAMSPLARAKQRIEAKREQAADPSSRAAFAAAIDVIVQVGEETGEEVAPIDPLTDETFRAERDLNEALGGDGSAI